MGTQMKGLRLAQSNELVKRTAPVTSTAAEVNHNRCGGRRV